MPQVRGTNPDLYDGVDKTIFSVMKGQLKELPRIYTTYYNVKTSDKKYERVVTYVPFGDTLSKPEGEPFVMDEIRQGYTKDFLHTENALGFEVTQTALEDDAENLLSRSGEWLAFSARYVEEGRAAAPFNNGFTTEQTPDGVSFFNTTHALKGGGTARNRPSTDADLSATSLTQALIDFQTQMVDEANHLSNPVQSLILLVPPALEFLADRLINSTQIPGSADNDKNPLKRRTWEIIVNPRLTDTDGWFVGARNKSQHGLTFYRRTGITMEPMMVDPRTNNRIFKIRHRFSVGAWTWVNWYGTPGA